MAVNFAAALAEWPERFKAVRSAAVDKLATWVSAHPSEAQQRAQAFSAEIARYGCQLYEMARLHVQLVRIGDVQGAQVLASEMLLHRQRLLLYASGLLGDAQGADRSIRIQCGDGEITLSASGAERVGIAPFVIVFGAAAVTLSLAAVCWAVSQTSNAAADVAVATSCTAQWQSYYDMKSRNPSLQLEPPKCTGTRPVQPSSSGSWLGLATAAVVVVAVGIGVKAWRG